MKRIFFLFFLLSSFIFNDATAQVYYSIDGGYTNDKTKVKVTTLDNTIEKNTYRYRGFYLGGFLHTRYFSPGVQFRQQHLVGEEVSFDLGNYALERQRFIDVPLTLDYVHVFSPDRIGGFEFIAMLTPSFNVSPSFDPSTMKRFDLDAIAGIRLRITAISFDFAVRAGLLDSDKRPNIKTNTFGYCFGMTICLPPPKVFFDDDYADDYMDRLENATARRGLGFGFNMNGR